MPKIFSYRWLLPGLQCPSCWVLSFDISKLYRLVPVKSCLFFLKTCSVYAWLKSSDKIARLNWISDRMNGVAGLCWTLNLCFWRYALLGRPSADEWNNKLRFSFLKGFKCLLQLLRCMQVSHNAHFNILCSWIMILWSLESYAFITVKHRYHMSIVFTRGHRSSWSHKINACALLTCGSLMKMRTLMLCPMSMLRMLLKITVCNCMLR